MKFGDNILSSQHGFNLVEVMLSLSILGFVTVGAITLGDQVSEGARMNRIGNNAFQVIDTINSRTFMERDCRNFIQAPSGGPFVYNPGLAAEDGINSTGAFEGQQLGISLPGISGPGEQVVSETNPQLGLLGFSIRTLRITNSIHLNDGDPGPPQNYLAYVELELERTGANRSLVLGASSIGLNKKRIVSAIQFETFGADPTQTSAMTSCRSAASDIDRQDLCEGTDEDGDGIRETGGLGPRWEWDPTTETCIPPQEPVACPAGQVLTEVQGKTPVCVGLGIEDQACPPGQFVVQLGIGFLACGTPGTYVMTPTPLPSSPPPPGGCAPQHVVWNSGGLDCSGASNYLIDSESELVGAIGGGVGSVTVTCNAGTLTQSSPICSTASPPSPTPSPTVLPIVSGCFVDTDECDQFTANSCEQVYSCGGSRRVTFSVGDSNETGGCHSGAGFGMKYFANPADYGIVWSGGACDSGGSGNHFCDVDFGSSLLAGSASRTVTVTRLSDGVIVHTQTIDAAWSEMHPGPAPCPPPN